MTDDRFGCPNVVDVLGCSQCDHFFVAPPLSLEEIGPLYENFYGRSPETELGDSYWRSNKLWRWVVGENNLGQFVLSPLSHPYLLDVGSGDCQNLWDAVRRGFDAVGFDVDTTSGKIASRHGLTVRTGDSVRSSFGSDQFDAVQMNQVLEHYVDPVTELKKIAECLRPGGALFISTPNANSIWRRLYGRRWINWHVPYHQQHFTKTSLQRALRESGFHHERVRTVTPLVWFVLQIRQAIRAGGWNGLSFRGARVIELALLLAVFIPLRILDRFGLGDCLVILAVKET